jgi:hypothetical protein
MESGDTNPKRLSPSFAGLKCLSAREWPGLIRFDRSVSPNRRTVVGASTIGEWAKGRPQELKRLQKENERLTRAISDLTLDKLILAKAARGNC